MRTNHRYLTTRTAVAALTLALLTATGARGTTTGIWEISTHEEFAKGTFQGTQVDSTGEVTMGISTVRAQMPGTALVWSSQRMGDDVYLGTGNEGALWLMRDERIVKLTNTESVVITSMATDGKGTLFAGTLPGGAILKFDGKKLEKLAKEALGKAPKVSWEPGHKTDLDEKDKKKKKKKKLEEKLDKKAKKEKAKKDLDEKKTKKGDEDGKKDGDEDKDDGEDGKKDGEKKKKKKKKKGPGHWVFLDDAEHVWALAYDPKNKTLYAGTGPEGIVYAVDPSGHATVMADTDEQHIMSLAVQEDGSLLAGTANGARILRIEGPGRVETVWDFDATEVKSLAIVDVPGEDDPAIVAAVNSFKSPPSFSVKMPSKKDLTEPGRSKGGSIRIPKGEGLVAAILPGGGYRKLMEMKKAHFTSMRSVEGAVQVATGDGGRVLQVDLQGRSALVLDVAERQVLTFDLQAKKGYAATADPGAVHRVLSQPPSDPYYLSDVFDAGFQARWGRLVLRGEGAYRWQTRTGNTKEPDDTWSSWTSPSSQDDGKIQSPDSRFLQFRLEVPGGASVYNVQAFYLPFNQQATITEITVGDQPGKKGKSTKSKDGKPEHDPEIEIKWKVENEDDDELSYELWFAQEGTQQWIAMLEEGQILTKTQFEWDTTSVPAGYYVVKLEATDLGVNDPKLALSHELISRSFVVDNDPPRVTLTAKGGKAKAKFSGKVEDDFCEISHIEISIDGEPFQTLFPEDLILDENQESYQHEATDLEPGPHTVTVRAYDRNGNATSAGAHFTVQ